MGFYNFYKTERALDEAVAKKGEDKPTELVLPKNATERTILYESIVAIMAMTRKATLSNIAKGLKHSEIHESIKTFLVPLLEDAKKNKPLEKSIINLFEDIGAQVTNLPGGTPSDFILKTINNNYYSKIDKSLKSEKSKENTADLVLVYSGTVADVATNMGYLTIDNIEENVDKNGFLTLVDKNGKKVKTKILQVSLKKEEDNARIGRFTTFAAQDLGPRKQIEKLPLPQKEETISESIFFDFIKNATTWTITSFKELYNKIQEHVKDIFAMAQSALGLATKKIETDTHIANCEELIKEIENGESVPTDESITIHEADVNAEYIELKPTLQKQFENVISWLKSSQYSASYNNMIKNIEQVNALDKKGKIILYKTSMVAIDKPAISKIEKEWKTIKKEKKFTRDWARPLFKLAANYTSYEYINSLLEIVKKNGKTLKQVKESIAGFVVRSDIESVFGNTQLPLWKVFGGKTKPKYLGFKTEYTLEKVKEITSTKEYPLVAVRVNRVKDSIHNTVNFYMLSDVNDKGPVYTLTEMTTDSGSKFSYKWEANSKVSYEKLLSSLN